MPTLSEYFQSFLVYLDIERGLSPNTLAAYAQDGRNFLESLAGGAEIDPSRLEEKDVFAFLVRERRRGRSVASVRRGLSAVRTFCRFLVRQGALSANPTTNIETPKKWQELPEVLELGEIERILAAVDEHPSRHPHRDRALLELAYATGLRVSEICSLRTDSIHASLGIVRCLGKGSRERVVPASQTALAAVAVYETEERPRLARRNPGTDILFLSRGGRSLGREVVRALLARYATLAGVPGRVTPHTLRHSMATHLLRGGADLRIVQEILGHVKAETTEIYTHIERSELKEAHRRFHPRG